MEIQYINLDRRPDRNAAFLELNSHLKNLRRVEAVDGSKLGESDLLREGFMAERLQAFPAGSLGNTMTHKRIWERGSKGGTTITVAEDDAVMNLQFESKAVRLLAGLPPDWDMVIWGWNFDSMLEVQIMGGMKRSAMRFDKTKLGAQVHEFKNKVYEVMPLPLLGSFGMVCYSVSPKGMPILLQKCFPLRHELIPIPGLGHPMWNCGIDVTLNKIYPSIKAYACFPPLVWTENDRTTSDVFRKPPTPQANP